MAADYTDFKMLALIEQDTTDTVNGWIRKEQKLLPFEQNPYYIIPQLVIYKCLMFYHQTNNFDVHGKRIFLNDAKDIAVVNPKRGGEWTSVYGKTTVKNIDPYIYKWEIEILCHSHHRGDIIIGFDSSFNKKPAVMDDDFAGDANITRKYYAYCSNGAKYPKTDKSNQGERFTKGDKIMVELNVDKKTINFYKNGICQDVEYDNIELLTYTRLAISLITANHSVKLTKFSCSTSKGF